ncbi:hypothetical protein F5Y13DRAFT_155263 [Hypoxylon sp. FL1857]|nr:hypothetical protein F5Y13DRAFT_155263 [Hypoxylon sp. FL1857]
MSVLRSSDYPTYIDESRSFIARSSLFPSSRDYTRYVYLIAYRIGNCIMSNSPLIAFNDMAKHNSIWRASNITSKGRISFVTIQHFLTLGLERILNIASRDSYTDRKRVLTVERKPSWK